MNKTETIVEDRIDELLVVLDKDIRHIEESLLRLDELRCLVIKRDEAAMGDLIRRIQSQTDSYADNECKRQSIRTDLAKALGSNVEDVTLSRIETILPGGKRAQVADRKAKLRKLIKKLKNEHLSTSMLLSECARINSALVRAIFDLGKTGTVVYGPNGGVRRSSDTAFVNLQF